MRTDGAKINLWLAEYAADHNMMKAYSLYLSAKAKYAHSVIYRFSYYKLSKIFKISPKTAKRYIKKLLDHNFCEVHHNNLLFRSPEKVMDSNGLYIEKRSGRRYYGEFVKLRIPANTTIKQIYLKVLEYRLANNIIQQEFNNLSTSGKIGEQIDLGSRSKDKAIFNYLEKQYPKHTDSEIAKLAKFFKPYVSKEMMRDVIVTSRGVARMLGVSHKTASTLLKELEHQNKLLLVPVIRPVYYGYNGDLSDEAIEGLKESGYGYYFWGSKTKRIYRYSGQAIVYKGDVTNRKSNFVRGEKFDSKFLEVFGIDPETRKIFNRVIKSKRSPVQRRLRLEYYKRLEKDFLSKDKKSVKASDNQDAKQKSSASKNKKSKALSGEVNTIQKNKRGRSDIFSSNKLRALKKFKITVAKSELPIIDFSGSDNFNSKSESPKTKQADSGVINKEVAFFLPFFDSKKPSSRRKKRSSKKQRANSISKASKKDVSSGASLEKSSSAINKKDALINSSKNQGHNLDKPSDFSESDDMQVNSLSKKDVIFNGSMPQEKDSAQQKMEPVQQKFDLSGLDPENTNQHSYNQPSKDINNNDASASQPKNQGNSLYKYDFSKQINSFLKDNFYFDYVRRFGKEKADKFFADYQREQDAMLRRFKEKNGKRNAY